MSAIREDRRTGAGSFEPASAGATIRLFVSDQPTAPYWWFGAVWDGDIHHHQGGFGSGPTARAAALDWARSRDLRVDLERSLMPPAELSWPENLRPPALADGRLRVGLWGPDCNLGGAEDWQMSLLRAVDPARVAWQGVAVTGGPEKTHPEMVRLMGAVAPIFYGVEGAREVARRSDVVVTWGLHGLADLLSEVAPRPRIVAVSHFSEEAGAWGFGLHEQPGIDRLVAVHRWSLGAIPPQLRADAAVIWNAVDGARLVASRPRAALRAAWGVPEGARVLGFLGRLASWQKDPSALVRALPFLPDDWHAVLVGEGDERPWLERIASENPRVHVPGGDRDAGSILNAFDCLCVPSEYECFGLSLAEGLWVGVPVISTPTGVAVEGDFTRLIPFRPSGPALASALLADLSDPAATSSRAARARSWARAHLSHERFGREWTEFLLGMVGSSKRG